MSTPGVWEKYANANEVLRLRVFGNVSIGDSATLRDPSATIAPRNSMYKASIPSVCPLQLKVSIICATRVFTEPPGCLLHRKDLLA